MCNPQGTSFDINTYMITLEKSGIYQEELGGAGRSREEPGRAGRSREQKSNTDS